MRATRFGRGFGLAAVLVVALLAGTFMPVGTLRAEAATGRPPVPKHRVDRVRPVDSTVGVAERASAREALAAAGIFEIFTRPSTSGNSELIMHRFFRPDY